MMKTNRVLLLIVGILAANISAVFAQPLSTSQHSSVGLHVGQFKNDVLGGISLTSPYFADKMLAIRLRANGQVF